jgi:anthranilate synthase component I
VLDEHASVDAAYSAGCAELDRFVDRLETHSDVPLPPGSIDLDLTLLPRATMSGNFTKNGFEDAVRAAKKYIAAGDAFQIVLSQRFERATAADPFEVYRALRIVNPSPYMIYLQARGSILIASSPEILCRVQNGVVTNRPLAGTRSRGMTPAQDAALERELRADEKERAEHVMLVDLGRNDLGRVCETASIKLEKIMDVERYSHVMHLSSTLTGRLRAGLDCWDALRNTLPVGTVSGAPKVRAMQIIDELEPTRRGPYAGGIGAVGFDGNMDIAIALRTMVIPTAPVNASEPPRPRGESARSPKGEQTRGEGAAARWTVHLQAGAGIVADSKPEAEYQETVSKCAALGRAIDLAESTFGPISSKSQSSTERTRAANA